MTSLKQGSISRNMHHHVCGRDFVGLCEHMKPIDGEVLLRFLRQVNFTGELISFIGLLLLNLLRSCSSHSCSYSELVTACKCPKKPRSIECECNNHTISMALTLNI